MNTLVGLALLLLVALAMGLALCLKRTLKALRSIESVADRAEDCLAATEEALNWMQGLRKGKSA
jgi:hypothetical protein